MSEQKNGGLITMAVNTNNGANNDMTLEDLELLLACGGCALFVQDQQTHKGRFYEIDINDWKGKDGTPNNRLET